MKMRLFFFACSMFSILVVSAQKDNTLIGENSDGGAFGSVFIEMSTINGQFGTDVGGGGAAVFNGFFLGGYGQGTRFPTFSDGGGNTYELHFNHGGLWMGYSPLRTAVIHPYASVKLGWGKVRLNPDDEGLDRISDQHFTLVPEAGVELNLTNSLHIVFSAAYRVVNGLENLPQGLDQDSFNSLMGKITFRIGSF
jgi:hypothetical protein